MLWDKQTLFSDSQALAAGNSTNVVQIQRGPGDFGVGDDVSLAVHVSGAPATALTVTLQQADTAAMTGATTAGTFTAAAAAVQKGGLVIAARLPTGTTGKFLRLVYAGPASGKVTAGLVVDAPAGVRPPLNSGL